VMIVCRAELLLLGLERLLAQESDLRVFTYSRLPAIVEESRGYALDEEAWAPAVGGGSGTRVALLSDRQAPDVVSQCEQILGSFADEVVLLSSRPDVGVLVGCMGAGARAFVMEGDPPRLLLAAIRSAARNSTYLGQRTLDLLVDWLGEQERSRVGKAGRARDDDLLRLLAQGRSTVEIAGRLGIAPKTVRNRIWKLNRRLGVHSRAAAVRLAEERGLLD
jgi:DNA-binding NarL/FixJ family response regulator